MRHGTCFRRRLSAHHAGAAPHSAVAELGVVRRSLPAVPRIAPAMTNSETNTPSYPSAFVPGALLGLDALGFGHADTLAEMGCVSPLRASHSLSSARRLRTPSVRGPVLLPGVVPPAPRPRFASHPPLHQHGPPHAAGQSAVPTFMRRFAATRIRCRQSERTPNHALQRTAPRVTVAAISYPGVSRPSHRCPTSAASFCAPPSQLPRHAPPSLSLGSLGDFARLLST